MQTDIDEYENCGYVYLVGDWNSRVGRKSDFIAYDQYNNLTDDEDYTPDCYMQRATMDSACNNFGVKLLDLCKSSGVRIVNGRLYNDIEGSFTFVNSQYSSVIDYLVTKPDCFNCLSDFSVGPFNEYIDHAELSFSLKCSSVPIQITEPETDGTILAREGLDQALSESCRYLTILFVV